ncbi:hypothetical protein CBS147332_8297 [Penicillium roqueforti]|nr:hypothetical protein CBS147332_8297 [Penicillium roqueforti]KAI3099969.1 hypothetical protein CBS147331_8340 [Penicillium roqueforti]
MPKKIPTLHRHAGQQIKDSLEAHSEVLNAINDVYNGAESLTSIEIDPESYQSLHIDVRSLEIDENGRHTYAPYSDPHGPVFFEPKGAAWVPPIVLTNPDCQRRLTSLTERWEEFTDRLSKEGANSQASYIHSALEWMFFQFRRQFYPPGDDRVPPNLRQESRWLESGNNVPSIIADEFYPAIWTSVRWSPNTMFVAKTPSGGQPRPPYVMITIVIGEQPSEGLFRAEVMTITAAMITRLQNEDFLQYNTIPIMAITVFGGMKARVIEAQSSQDGLVIKKTQLFDFSTNEVANESMNILLGFMSADLVGNPRMPTVPKPTVVIDIPKVCTLDVLDGAKDAEHESELTKRAYACEDVWIRPGKEVQKAQARCRAT